MNLAPAGITLTNGVADALVAEVHASGQSLVAWGIAWARVLPLVVLLPAFGLGFLPGVWRVAIAFMVGLSLAPALRLPAIDVASPWPSLVAEQIARGIPLALAASISLWAASVAGGIADTSLSVPRVRLRTPRGPGGPPFETLMGLLAAILFLDGGGTTRALSRLADLPAGTTEPLRAAAFDLAAGIDVGASLAAPLLVVSLVMDMTSMVVARELPSIRSQSFLAPLRTLVVLVATAALLDRIVEGIAIFGRR